MFDELGLENFKSFGAASFPLSPFTLLVGANASGKSNVREAFRFLHGIARGYTLAEVVGEKWIEGGSRVWTGVRGGAAQIARHGTDVVSVRARFAGDGDGVDDADFDYRIDVEVVPAAAPRVVREHLSRNAEVVYEAWTKSPRSEGSAPTLCVRPGGRDYDGTVVERSRTDRPVLTFMPLEVFDRVQEAHVLQALTLLGSMVFLDLSPDAAREASPVGITTLGDRGENLSSVLQEICRDRARQEQLTSWVRALTPMDAESLEFVEDLNGRVLAQLVEGDGSRTPLTSASDGTVRFLAMVTALLNPDRPRFVFVEEIENGIHPNRVHLLLELIGQSVLDGRTQVVATSHSPQLLAQAYRSQTASPCLVFRGDGSHVLDVREVPQLRAVLDHDDPGSLMAAGWFEDSAAFLEDDLPDVAEVAG